MFLVTVGAAERMEHVGSALTMARLRSWSPRPRGLAPYSLAPSRLLVADGHLLLAWPRQSTVQKMDDGDAVATSFLSAPWDGCFRNRLCQPARLAAQLVKAHKSTCTTDMYMSVVHALFCALTVLGPLA